MLRNYFKIAWRNIIKNKGLTLIHLIGLSTAFAITLLIVQFVNYEMSFENHNPNVDTLARVTLDYMDGETVETQDCEVYPALGTRIAKDILEVKTFTRVYRIGEPKVSLNVNQKKFILKKAFAVDADFLKMFNYGLLYGDIGTALKGANEIVISTTTALKLFNKKNVLGEQIEMLYGTEKSIFTIVGVCNDSPNNTHLKFNLLVSYPSLLQTKVLQVMHGEKENNWEGNNSYCYVQLTSKTQQKAFEKAIKKLSNQLNNEKKIKNERLVSQPVKNIHLYSQKTFEPEINGSAKTLFFLLAIAFLIILSALINYTNLATSKALDRAKEVGVKKVVGSSKNQLRTQFLLEALIVSALSGVLALILLLLSNSFFISISNLPKDIPLFNTLSFWVLFFSLVFTGAVLSGVYPALILSSFKPVLVLNGKFSQSKKGVFVRKALVVFQFSITIILLVQAFTVKQQIDYIRNLNKGVKINKTIVVDAPAARGSKANYPAFKNKLLAQTNIKNVSMSHTVPGQSLSELSTMPGINLKGKTTQHNYNFYITFIDDSYVPLFELDLLSGTNFSAVSEGKRQIIVNEEALKRWDISNPRDAINKVVSFWGNEWTIIGVVKNYHQETPKAAYIPMIHIYYNIFRSLASIQFVGGLPENQLKQIKTIYDSVYPNTSFSYFFLDKLYEKQFDQDKRFQTVFTVLTAFSILISCLGLLGLTSFSVSKRKKEIGIRKVVGASVINILVLLSSDFLKTVGVAICIGLPITFFITNKWLQNFAFKIELEWWLFGVPVFLVLLIVVLAIGTKTIKTAIANPVNSLRTE